MLDQIKSSLKVCTGDKLNIYNLNFKEKFKTAKKKFVPNKEIIKENEELKRYMNYLKKSKQ